VEWCKVYDVDYIEKDASASSAALSCSFHLFPASGVAQQFLNSTVGQDVIGKLQSFRDQLKSVVDEARGWSLRSDLQLVYLAYLVSRVYLVAVYSHQMQSDVMYRWNTRPLAPSKLLMELAWAQLRRTAPSETYSDTQ
jgi:hypothetical protein